MSAQAKLTDYEQELIIGRPYSYYRHRGCGGVVKQIALNEMEILKCLFDYDIEAYNWWLKQFNISIFDLICFRCFGVIRRVEVRCDDGLYTFKPNPNDAEYVEEFRFIPYKEHINIVRMAYQNVSKYKDGTSTRDAWLAVEIARILKDKGLRPKDVNPERLGLRIIGMPVVDWAIEQGLFEVVREVEYDIPYAYRKHGWRGIKTTIYWRVIKPTEKFENF